MAGRLPLLLLLLAGCRGGAGTRIEKLPPDPAAEGYRLLPRPVVLPRGETTYDCGPESLAAVVQYWEKPAEVAVFSRLLVNPRLKGTVTGMMVSLARRKGLYAKCETGSMGLIKGSVDAGTPPIIAVRLTNSAFHYYVVSGYNDRLQSVVCEERDGSKTLYPYDRLDRMWSETGHFFLRIEPSSAAKEYETGADYEDVGNYERAEEHFRRALEADPTFHEARFGLGNCLLARGKTEEALLEFEQVLKAMPSDAKTRNNVAHSLCELGRDLPRAEELAAAAVASFTSLRKEAQEDYDAARVDYERHARATALEDARIDLAYGLGTLGQVRYRRENWDGAIAAWTASLAEFPGTDGDFLARRNYEIALALRRLGREDEAKRRLAEARKAALDPALRAKIDEALR